MFSTILHSSAAFLFPYYVPSESASNSQVDQQIQTELQQAAEQGMVFTRSQDSTPAGGASQSSELLCPQILVYDKKRKASNGRHESPAQAVTKRRRRSTKPNREAAPSSSASNPGRPPRNVSTKTAYAIDPNVSDQEPSALGSRVNPSQTPGTTTEKTINNDEDKAIEVAINKPSRTRSSDDEVSVAHDRVKPHSDSATRSRKGKIQKKSTKDSDGIAAVDRNGAGMRISGKKPKTFSATAAMATHKRFGSEGIEEPGTVRTNGIEEREGSQEDISEDEGDSGDEAPETVTASAGFDKARASALDAAKVAARQETDKKLRRREHDERLRLQAKAVKDSQSKDKPSSKGSGTKGFSPEVIKDDAQASVEKPKSLAESPQTLNDKGQTTPAKPKSSSRKTPLPLLLPEEILAAEPAVHAPIPSLSKSKLAVSQKRKFLDLEPKPPKDVKRGNLTVRVLHDNRSILPPKSSQASKALRESWLAGRRGFKGEIGVPRRKPNGGFVRKK